MMTEEDPRYEIGEDYLDPGEEVHLAWTDREEEIPPKLLRYLKKNYSVKTGYSKTAGTCFANHCDCCGAIQGNWFLFGEPDSPLSSDAYGTELIIRMEQLKIKAIPSRGRPEAELGSGLLRQRLCLSKIWTV